jgi:hypothetical protein
MENNRNLAGELFLVAFSLKLSPRSFLLRSPPLCVAKNFESPTWRVIYVRRVFEILYSSYKGFYVGKKVKTVSRLGENTGHDMGPRIQNSNT